MKFWKKKIKHPMAIQETLPGMWKMLRRFWPEISKHRWLVNGSLLAVLAELVLRSLEPWPVKFVFDRVLATKHATRWSGVPGMNGSQGMDPITLLTVAGLALVTIVGLRALASYANTVGFALIGNRVLTEVRNNLYRHLQGLSLSYHTKAKGGDLLVRISRDVDLIKDCVATAILPVLANALLLPLMIGLMLYMHWKLGLVALSVVPLCWLSTVRTSRKIHEVARSQRMREGAVASTAAESMTAIKTVQALSLEGKFADLFYSHNVKSQKEDVRGKKLEASLQRRVDVIMALATALVLWYGSLEVFHHRLSPGDILVFLAYLKNAMKPIQDLGKYTGRLAKATAAGERIIDVLDSVSEVRDRADAVDAPVFQGAVQFDHVSYGYEPGHPVLRNLNVVVARGQRVALIGPSGGGKSTFLGMILRFHDPAEGRVLIDGRDLREYKLISLRPQISVVLQDTLLFATSVWDNIGCAAPEATREQIIAAARLANAHEFILELPLGYDTVLGERGVTLSGGQRQRIAIARAAIRKAPILILDEPMTGLDEENEREVIEALERVSAGCTTFLISHDLQHALRADLIIYLEEGRAIEQGTHHELMAANGRYARTYRMQAAQRHSQDVPANPPPLPSTTPG